MDSPSPKTTTLVWMAADFIHGFGIMQPTVLHDVQNGFTVVYVIKQILIQHDKVGELAGLQGAQMAIQTDILCSLQSGSADGFHRCHPALYDYGCKGSDIVLHFS